MFLEQQRGLEHEWRDPWVPQPTKAMVSFLGGLFREWEEDNGPQLSFCSLARAKALSWKWWIGWHRGNGGCDLRGCNSCRRPASSLVPERSGRVDAGVDGGCFLSGPLLGGGGGQCLMGVAGSGRTWTDAGPFRCILCSRTLWPHCEADVVAGKNGA